MKFIAHRGNIEGKNVERENQPEYILEAIQRGFDVEIDVWRVDDKYYLGHDNPQYEIDRNFLLENSNWLWCHAKNLEVLWDLLHYGQINIFWHQNDDHTVTSKGFIWTYPNKEIIKHNFKQIILLFDWTYDDVVIPYGGICSDYIELYRNKYEK